MEKQLKDYLHFYLGCDIQLPVSESPETKGVVKLTPEYLLAMYVHNEWDYAKLILRKLSSMTEEECWYSQNNFGHFVKGTSDEYIKNRLHCIKESYMEFRNIMPDQFRWLLSKHFDLFDLIPAGLAIEASTINQ